MPVEFLTDEQVAAYGRYVGPPSRTELERFFFLNDRDRELVKVRRRPHTRLGFAVQLGTVRFLGTFLPDPLDVPVEVVAYQARQLGIEDVLCLRAYAEREMTPHEHVWEIRREFGYRDFAEAEDELRSFIVARCATTAEEPKALFDRAVAWLVERKVLLPGVTTLARLVASLRREATESLSLEIVDGVDSESQARLIGALDVGTGSRFSDLEQYRKSPTRTTGLELERALRRVVDVRQLGRGIPDLSGLPENRVLALARYGMSAKAPALRELKEPRRTSDAGRHGQAPGADGDRRRPRPVRGADADQAACPSRTGVGAGVATHAPALRGCVGQAGGRHAGPPRRRGGGGRGVCGRGLGGDRARGPPRPAGRRAGCGSRAGTATR